MHWLKEKLRALERFLREYESWRDDQKALLACGIALVVQSIATASFYLTYFVGTSPTHALVVMSFAHGPAWHVLFGTAIAYVVLLPFIWWTRFHPRLQSVGAYVFILVTGLTQAFHIYSLGTFSTYLIAPLPVGVAFAFLLFDWRKGLVGMIFGVVVLTLTNVLEQFHVLPYAPGLAPSTRPPLPPPEIVWLAIGMICMVSLVLYLSFYYVFRALTESRDKLVRAESLAAVGALVTGAAHELRNPLASSGALLQSLRDDLARDESIPPEVRADAAATLDRALIGQNRAAAIVERLYELTDQLDVQGSKAVLGDFEKALKEKYPQVRLEMSEEARALVVRQPLLTTILPNLISNALSSGAKEPPEVSLLLKDGHLECAVSDRGRGIPKTLQPHVFKPFVTGEKAGEGHGVGLGLYVVYELATRLGGSVELESGEGAGTQVRVKVPV